MTNTRAPQTGLQLPKDVGVSQTTADAVANEWDTLPYVDERLKGQGMRPNIEPDVQYIPVTAEQLMVPDVKMYTTTYASHLRWYNYVVRLLADVRAELLQVENQKGDIERVKRSHFRTVNEGRKKTDRMSVQEMADVIEDDPTYHILKIRQQELEQLKLKVTAWSEEMDRNLKTISRQIENRRAEVQGGNRENNMPGHAGGRWRDV
jgi:hypothetical protein